MAEENSGILGDEKSFFGLFFDEGGKILVGIQQILVLVAMAGKNVGNQRLRFSHRQGVRVRQPLGGAKDGGKEFRAIFPAKPLVKLIGREHNPVIKLLHQPADFFHMQFSVGAAEEGSPRL